MFNKLKTLCEINAPSGFEENIRKYIIKEIAPYCEYSVDKLGNIICLKKGENRSAQKLMIDAHMDEVGIIITSITDSGFLKFCTLGGINDNILISRTVTINNNITGVIGCKPVHLINDEDKKKIPKSDALYIDIGCTSRIDAEKKVSIGDCGVLNSATEMLSDTTVTAKALDDRAGCFTLIELLKTPSKYDFYATFTTQEELGCRGAKVAAYGIDPDVAIILETTTAADIMGVADEDKVCSLGHGTAVSFMDRSTLYDRELYNTALSSGIPCQPKSLVSGGNNAGAVHLNRKGVRTISLSVPCRYLHTPYCLCDLRDIESTIKLSEYMINKICSGEV